MKLTSKIIYMLNVFPAFSIIFIFFNVYISSRFISLLLVPIILFQKSTLIVDKYLLPIILLFYYFACYSLIAIIDNKNFIIYFGYAASFLYIILMYDIVRFDTSLFIRFMKLFLIANVAYVIFQLFVLNASLSNFSMLHSNSPAQVNYSIPIFIDNYLFRYTGLFNESAPFVFYLSIAYAFFHSLKSNYKKYALVLIIFSGSKAGYIFLLLHYAFFSEKVFVKSIFIALLATFLVLFFAFYEDLSYMTSGQTASLNHRFINLINFDNYTWFGVDLEKTSEGKLGLNFLNIFVSGFGLFGLSLIFLAFATFYLLINTREKKYFIPPLVVGLLSSGSLLIVQYSLLFASIFCLHSLSNNSRVYNDKY